ncbi:phage Gp37/Gp68 family protein [Roseomonas frigidaquae]|uniref:Phage Gp37/Gp68 family protein n=1 Tax=Falsiroseomonas frigidaquae TaxID=487318 RepID=A0ABX1ESZ0_9PROT|nr:phage Gp37/Gp68 family protein [Falsiroseomonas frigidaquae]NKE43418.1 phage Gp37/Gp68 family protein [Falsiroseomonas frigidaquae]
MGENSAIEWCEHTFNPWFGCTKVSPGCDHCYAEALATKRLGVAWGPHAERRFAAESTWKLPHRWNRAAAKTGQRARVFCASLADVFDNQADAAWLLVLMETIRTTPNLDWLLLTKRPQQIIPRLRAACIDAEKPTLTRWDTQSAKAWIDGWLAGDAPRNVWLGTTAENQAEADRRIPHLLAAPAAKRFLSCEPLLGPVDLSGWLPGDNGCQGCDDGDGYGNRCASSDIPRDEQCPWNRAVQTIVEHGPADEDGAPAAVTSHVETIDWVISGGESGPGARPSHPEWHRSLRDQCAAAGLPFFFKQWGEWAPHRARAGGDEGGDLRRGHVRYLQGDGREPDGHFRKGDAAVAHVGKKAAGALLDGREHREVPA